MQMDARAEQHRNAASSICDTLHSGPNVTVKRDSHPEKHDLHSFSTEEGMPMDESDEQDSNAESAMHESSQPEWNVTTEME
jgi:hypothetical protein